MTKGRKKPDGQSTSSVGGGGKGSRSVTRRIRGRGDDEAAFPVAPPKSELPDGYVDALSKIRRRIQLARVKTMLAANSSMILLYWDIGRLILERQEKEGWGAKVIDRLSSDLRDTYPDMTGLSSRNLKYMRAFAAAWPEPEIVQRVVAQLPWRQNIALIERLDDRETRLWYAEQTIRNGWSQPILRMQIDNRLHDLQGKALHNFEAVLPPADSDLVGRRDRRPHRMGPWIPREGVELGRFNALSRSSSRQMPFASGYAVAPPNFYPKVSSAISTQWSCSTGLTPSRATLGVKSTTSTRFLPPSPKSSLFPSTLLPRSTIRLGARSKG